MTEKIGLSAYFDLTDFDKGVTGLLRAVDKANKAIDSLGDFDFASGTTAEFNKIAANSARMAEKIEKANERAAEASQRAYEKSTNWQIVQADKARVAIERDAEKKAAAEERAAQRAAVATEKAANRQIAAYQRASAAAARTASAAGGGGGGGGGGGITLPSMGGGFGNILGVVSGAMAGVTGLVGNALSMLAGIVGRGLQVVAGMFGSVFKGIVSAVGGILGGLLSMVSGIFGSIIGVVSGIFKGIVSVVGNILGGLASVVRGALSIIGNIFSSVLNGVMNIVGGIFNGIVSVISSAMSLIGSVISTGLSIVQGIFQSVFNGLVSLIQGIFSTILNVVQSGISLIGQIISRGFSLITSVVGSIFSGLVSLAKNIFSSLVNVIGSIFSGLVNLVGNILSGIPKLFSAIFSIGGTILRTVSSFVSTVLGFFIDFGKKLFDIVSGVLGQVVGVFSKLAEAVLKVMGGMAEEIYSTFTELGKYIVVTIGAAAAAIVTAVLFAGNKLKDWTFGGIKAAAEFEQQMADIASVLRKTRAEVQPLADQIDEMALDPKLVVSAEEAGAVVESLSRNGLTMTEIMEGGAKATILLANATGGDFKMSADVATMALRMFNMEASELNKVADISQGVINNSRIELDDWALALGNGGAAAAASGVPLEDFATVVAATINSFHSARQAGTSYMNFIQRLVPITDTAGEAMKELGLFTGLTDDAYKAMGEELEAVEKRLAELDPRLVFYDELVEAHTKRAEELRTQMVKGTNAFFDQNGQMKEMTEVVQILTDATKDLGDEERTEAFRRIFGNDAYETAIRLSKMTSSEFETLKAEIVIQGSAAEASATRTNTLAKAWENLADIWATIQRKSGAAFDGLLRNIVKRLTELTNQNQERVIAFFERFAALFSKLVDSAMPWIEKIMPVLINDLEALASWLIETALGGDKADDWLNKMSPHLRSFIDKVITTVAAVKQFAGWLVELATQTRKFLSPFIEWIKANTTAKDVLVAAGAAVLAFLAPLGFLIARMTLVGLAAIRAVSWIRKAWEEDFGGIRTTVTTIMARIQEPLERFINSFLKGEWANAWNALKDIVLIALGEIEKHIPDFFKPFVNLISDLLRGDWQGAWDNIKKIVVTTFEGIKQVLLGFNTPFTNFLFNILEGNWEEVWDSIVIVAIKSFELIKKGLTLIDTPFTDFLVNVLEGDWEAVWKSISTVAVVSFKIMKEALKGMKTPFTDFIVKILEGDWEGVWEDISNAARMAFKAIIKVLREFETPLTDFIANVLTGAWDEAWDYIKMKALLAYSWIVEKLYAIDTPISNFLGNVLTGKWDLVWEDIKRGATTAYNWVVEKLYEIDNPVATFLADVMTGNWTAVWESVKTGATIAYAWVVDGLYGLDTPFTTFLADILTGKWNAVWETVKSAASIAYQWITDGLYGLDMPFTTFIADVLTGKWGSAWETAKAATTTVRDWIVEWLVGLNSPFATFAADILVGNWGAAWTAALGAVTIVKDALVDWLADKGPWGKFASEIIDGEWKTAWDTAKGIIFGEGGLVPTLRTWLEDRGPWGKFASEILGGEWKTAWDTAKELIFGEQGLITRLANWLVDKGPWAKFASDILKGDFTTAWNEFKELIFGEQGLITRLANWLADKGPWEKFASSVLKGEFYTAWTELKVLIGLTDDKIKLIKDTLYLMVGVFAIATATLIAFNLRGMAAVGGGLLAVGGIILQFLPLIVAIGIAAAALRVAWEEDFMGIQKFTGQVLTAIGQIISVGLLFAGDIIDLFMLTMKEDWAGAWEKVKEISEMAWQLIARAALTGLSLIESFMTEGPGREILLWLATTMPTVMTGLESIFTSSSSLISSAWTLVTQTILGTQSSWGGFFAFIESTVGIAAQRIGNFIGFVDGVLKFFNTSMQASQDAIKGMELEGQKALQLSKGDTAGADATQLLIQQQQLESAATRNAVGMAPIDLINQSIDAFNNILAPREDRLREQATASANTFIDTVLSVTAASRKKLDESIIPDYFDEEALRNRFGTQATLIKDLFATMGEGMGEIPDPVTGLPTGLSKLKAEFQKMFDSLVMPADPTLTDPNRPTGVYDSIFNAIKGLGIDLTGGFLETGKETIKNLGAGAESEKQSLIQIFQGIMGEITTAASGMVDAFGTLGSSIGNALKTGIENALEISSPSKVFLRIGKMIHEGLGKGLRDNAPISLGAIADFLKKMVSQLNDEEKVDMFKKLFGNDLLEQALARAGTTAKAAGSSISNEDKVDLYRAVFGSEALGAALGQAGTAAAKAGSRLHDYAVTTAMHQPRTHSSYSTSSNSVHIGPVHLHNVMDVAEFEYRVKGIVRSMGAA